MPTLSPSLDATLARADLCARKTDRFGIAIFALRNFAVGESILIEDPILAIDAVALRAHHLHPIFASATERHGLSAEASTACALHAMCEAGAAQRARIALLHTHAEDEEDQPSVVGHYRRRLLGVSRSLLGNVEFCTVTRGRSVTRRRLRNFSSSDSSTCMVASSSSSRRDLRIAATPTPHASSTQLQHRGCGPCSTLPRATFPPVR